jgi:hypothetical protein
VLTERPLDRAAMPNAAWRLFERSLVNAPNGCYVLTRPRGGARTYAGLNGVAGTRWRIDGKRPRIVRFTLYRSPDASHQVEAARVAGGLRGRGRSRGFGTTMWSPVDTIVAERVGPPDVGRCVDAVMREGRERRSTTRAPDSSLGVANTRVVSAGDTVHGRAIGAELWR